MSNSRLFYQLSKLKGIDKVKASIPAAELIAVQAQINAPVDTGELRGSIHVETTPDSSQVVASAKHAIFVEMGTYKMPARPFMRDAINQRSQAALNAIADELEKQFKELIG